MTASGQAGSATPDGGDWLVAPELAPDAADPVLAPLYEAAARGVLAMPFCGACGTPLELEQLACDSCDAAVPSASVPGDATPGREWREVPPAGTVHAATLVHRLEPGLIVAGAPYPVVDVELASGHRAVLTTAQASRDAPVIGTQVEIAFRTVGAVTLPAVRIPRAAPPAGKLRQERCHDGH